MRSFSYKPYAIFSALLLTFLSAQNPDTLWTRVFGGTNQDYGNSVQTCPDGGYVVCGSTSSLGAGGWDIYLIRTDSLGDTLWTRTYGGPENDCGYDVKVTHDRGFVIGGYTNSFGAGRNDLYIVRVDSLGDTLWTKTFGGPSDDEGCAIQETPDLGYLVCGTTYSFGAGIGDVYLAKVDSLGDSLWAYTYGGTSNDLGADVTIEPDSCLMICGTTYSFGAGGGDPYLIKTNSKGDTIWTRTYGSDSDEWAYDILGSVDGGFVIAGSTYFSLLGDDMFVFKVDKDGNVQWNFYNGSLGDDYAYAVGEIPNRGYVIGGNFSYELFVIRTDSSGNNQQQWIFGGAGTDCVNDVAVNSDGSYVLVGNTTSFGQGMTDIWLIKMAQDTLGVCESKGRTAAIFNLDVIPNPFRDRAVFRIPGIAHSVKRIELNIYDVSGRLVNSFAIRNTPFAIRWSGTDQNGRTVPAGVYFLVCSFNNERQSEKIVRLK